MAVAQSSLTLSVTPPLIQNIVEPGDIWKSQVKIINPNPFDLTVYIDKKLFVPEGERGKGSFIDIPASSSGKETLPEWIDITDKPITIPREKSKVVEFIIEVPEDAPPGGHFAALQVGTRPPEGESQNLMQTTQIVTSLFFLQIKGDITEEGGVREFSTENNLYATPEAEFILRFENKGNVHIQPQGVIEIYNMWGKERGVIPVNNSTQFGNVLPDTIRKFTFSWKGEHSVFDIGRYTAVATLGYGTHSKAFVSGETSFWVIPIKATFITLGIVGSLLWFVVFAIKLYIRRMLASAGVTMQRDKFGSKEKFKSVEKRKLIAPIREALLELSGRLRSVSAINDIVSTLGTFVGSYRLFFAAVIAFCILFILLVYYFNSILRDEKSYEVTVEEGGDVLVIDSEEVHKEEIKSQRNEPIFNTPEKSVDTQEFDIEIINASGVLGAAAETSLRLEKEGYVITDLRTERGRESERTVIVYSPQVSTEALAISKSLNNALLSASTSEENTILIFVGKDQSR